MIDSVLFSAQFIGISCGQTGYAVQLIRESGFSRREFLKSNRLGGYEEKKTLYLINEALPVKKTKSK